MRRAPPGPAEQQGPTRTLVPGAGRTLQGHSGAWRQSVTVQPGDAGARLTMSFLRRHEGLGGAARDPSASEPTWHLRGQPPLRPPCTVARRRVWRKRGTRSRVPRGFPPRAARPGCRPKRQPLCGRLLRTLCPTLGRCEPGACARLGGGCGARGGRLHHRQHLSTCGQGQLAQEGSVEGCTENHPWPPVGRCGRRPQLGLHVLASVARLDDETKSPSHVSLRACAEAEGSVGSV